MTASLREVATYSRRTVNAHVTVVVCCYHWTMGRTIVLSDEAGNAIGSMDLLKAHTGRGSLHRAFSVYVWNPKRTKLLLQRRSEKKMLWPGIWANTCCSHPFENESSLDAGQRRLNEEMGIVCALNEGLAFVYRAEDPAGRGVEHEYVRILTSTIEESAHLSPDPEEVAEWKWMDLSALHRDFRKHPDLYAPWLKIGLEKVLNG